MSQAPFWARMIAVGFEWILNGPPTAAGDLAASGATDPKADVRRQIVNVTLARERQSTCKTRANRGAAHLNDCREFPHLEASIVQFQICRNSDIEFG